jgi:hypothetical protein
MAFTRKEPRHRKGGDLQYRGSEVLGRLYWDASHPSPWVIFKNITEYRRWAAEVRRARPGTKCEYVMNIHHNPAWLLACVRGKAHEEMAG